MLNVQYTIKREITTCSFVTNVLQSFIYNMLNQEMLILFLNEEKMPTEWLQFPVSKIKMSLLTERGILASTYEKIYTTLGAVLVRPKTAIKKSMQHQNIYCTVDQVVNE